MTLRKQLEGIITRYSGNGHREDPFFNEVCAAVYEVSESGAAPEKNISEKKSGRAAANHGDPKPLIGFDWTTGEFENLGDEEVDRWRATFPAVDVDCEIAKAAAWLTADRRRAKSQYRRFLVGWLTRSQDKGGSRPWAGSRR